MRAAVAAAVVAVNLVLAGAVVAVPAIEAYQGLESVAETLGRP